MTSPGSTADTAERVADWIHAPGPWEVFAEKIRRYEIHLNGRTVELIRGPIALEGYGVRRFHSENGRTRNGFQASTDLSLEGVRQVIADAEAMAKHSDFPAKSVRLPSRIASPSPSVEIADRALWERPFDELREHVEAILAAFDGRKNATPSFGSVRATLSETSMANSEGLRCAYPQTEVEFEIAVKASGGPEGAAPGEYWVNETTRRLETKRVTDEVAQWCRYAEDVRRASSPPTGELPVILPASLSSAILPTVLSYRFSGQARLRQIAPNLGEEVGAPGLTLWDDGLHPWGINSSPIDDEGTSRGLRALVEQGRAGGLLYDLLHAGAFDETPTGNASRGLEFGFRDWRRFAIPPTSASSTLVVKPGDGGTDEELAEAAGEGVWIQQLGWPVPDPISSAFGGEIRIGYRIRGGKFAEPIRGGTMGGVVLAPPGAPSMLNGVAAIGSQAALDGGLSSPALLIKNLTVAGA